MNGVTKEIFIDNSQHEEGYEEFNPELFKPKVLERLEERRKEALSRDEFSALSAAGMQLFIAEEPDMLDVFVQAQALRGPSTSIELINLGVVQIPNLLQAIILEREDYPVEQQLYTPEKWRDLHKFNHKYFRDYILHLLSTKHIQTNISNRGNYLPFLLRTAWGEESGYQENPEQIIELGEAGASANFILSRLACNGDCSKADPYRIDRDNTIFNGKKGLVRHFAEQPVNIHGYGLDLVYPLATDEGIAWFLACDQIRNMRPDYLAEKRKQIELYRKGFPNVKFFEGNMCNLPFADNSFHVFSYPTSLYELTKAQRELALAEGARVTREDGFMAVADYFDIDEVGNLTLTKGRKDKAYGVAFCGERTGGRWLDILKFPEGSFCIDPTMGIDFDYYMREIAKWR